MTNNNKNQKIDSNYFQNFSKIYAIGEESITNTQYLEQFVTRYKIDFVKPPYFKNDSNDHQIFLNLISEYKNANKSSKSALIVVFKRLSENKNGNDKLVVEEIQEELLEANIINIKLIHYSDLLDE